MTKIVILGGGVSAITTAMRLTDDDRWRDRFESITLYQMGWRLGGKGATGRGMNGTVEEHGLHVWLGFYENAFQTIQRVYESAARPPQSRLSRWSDGFEPQDDVGVNEFLDGGWRPWMFAFPRNGRVPGSGAPPGLLATPDPLRAYYKTTLEWSTAWAEKGLTGFIGVPQLVEASQQVQDPAYDQEVIAKLNDVDAQLVNGAPLVGSLGARRYLLLARMGVTVVRGLLADGIFDHDHLNRLQGEDISQWLKRHGALPDIWDPKRNALLRGLYDFAFAYENGDPERPNFSTAPALRTVFRMCLTYKGSVFYKMIFGMGDTIFAPAYEALRNRGVGVEFFHKVTNLALSSDRRRIDAIDFEVQATMKDRPYEPLVGIPGCEGTPGSVPCWPNQPRYEFLNEGDELREREINLESFWTSWRSPGGLTLRAGEHFDVAVFGISVGAVPFVCPELVEASGEWADMVREVRTVGTQAVQVWPRQTLPELQWTDPSPVLDAWVQPLNTWGDLTKIIDSECWPAAERPGSLAYFCGPRMGGIPPQEEYDFPAQAHAQVVDAAEVMLTRDIGTLWPALGSAGLPPADRRHMYCRANIDPSDRYVLSRAGSAVHRLAADQSGFDNLVLTGDWIDNGYNAGCVEAATWSGIQAANVILGRPLNDGVIF